MKSLALALLLALPLSAHALQPPMPPPAPPAPDSAIKLPDKVTTPANKVGKIVVEGSAKSVKWVALTPGLSFEITPDGRTLYYAGAAGSYDLIAYTAVGDVPSDPVRVTVVIGDPPAPVPPPVPPVPPTPPKPVPVDPLKAKLSAVFASAAGTPADKSEWAKDLAALYRAGAKMCADPAVTTATALKTKLSAAAGALVGPDALKEVRQAVAGELAAVLPTTEADLTTDQRTAAAALFTKLAAVLDGLAQ
jgi:hypothetical protein